MMHELARQSSHTSTWGMMKIMGPAFQWHRVLPHDDNNNSVAAAQDTHMVSLRLQAAPGRSARGAFSPVVFPIPSAPSLIPV
mmetsp:Transcript_36911/g.92245  ORF Transcript_36911/g.92245 Transcript_36911/m.92245 type:complete len:82 (-) Transcript_36911:13-258(-)